VVSSWIAEVSAERTRMEIELHRIEGRRMTKAQVTALVDQMAGITRLLHSRLSARL
jgi:hypothetical protein